MDRDSFGISATRVVVAQLEERSIPKPKVRGSNPVLANSNIGHLFVDYHLYWKDENKKPMPQTVIF